MLAILVHRLLANRLSGAHRGRHLGVDQRAEKAATSLPLGSYVYVPEWDTAYRVADRGYLAANHLDFPVSSRAAAYEITGWWQACPL